MATLIADLLGVPNGEVYPRVFAAGEECPPELTKEQIKKFIGDDVPANLSSKDLATYVSAYDAVFVPAKGMSRAAWEKLRAQRINKKGDPEYRALMTFPTVAEARKAINENFQTLEWASIFGRRHPVTTGLTWGYYGGRYGGTVIADGTVTLSANDVNELVMERATGEVMLATGSPNEWDNTGFYARLYRVTTNASAVTAVEDHRLGPGGLFITAEVGASNAATAAALQTARDIDGVAFDGTADITVIAPATHAASNKATPVDADELPLADSVSFTVPPETLWLIRP